MGDALKCRGCDRPEKVCECLFCHCGKRAKTFCEECGKDLCDKHECEDCDDG